MIKKGFQNFSRNLELEKGKIVLICLLFLFFLLFFFNSVFITVYPGYVGVKFNRLFGGTVADKVYPDGVYVIFPWDKMYAYDVRVQGFDQEVEIISQNGLKLTVYIAVRFHLDPNRLPTLHLGVGPDYLEKVAIPLAVSSVRDVVARYRPEEVYSVASQKIQDEILIEILSELGGIPILFDNILIKRIELPDVIHKAIQNKLVQEQLALAYEFRLKAQQMEIERKLLEARGIEQYNILIRETLTPDLLTWLGIQATKELATSENAKVVVIGGGSNGLPIILNAETPPTIPVAIDGSGTQQSPLEPVHPPGN